MVQVQAAVRTPTRCEVNRDGSRHWRFFITHRPSTCLFIT